MRHKIHVVLNRTEQEAFNAVLDRIANEGWAKRKSGYGWTFSTMLTTPDRREKS